MIREAEYQQIVNSSRIDFPIEINDHLGGFDQELHNPVLEHLNTLAKNQNIQGNVLLHMPVFNDIKKRYPNLNFDYKMPVYMWDTLTTYEGGMDIEHRNFVCSFNGSPSVSRKLLVAALNRRGWYCPEYVSKNFAFSVNEIDGHIDELVKDQHRLYCKFFINYDKDEEFFNTVNSFGYVKSDHKFNIYNLRPMLTTSFLNIVSETIGTSYYPFITEKFLYSVVTCGLFVAYAQPGWHKHLSEKYGFKLYNQIFDYKFDNIVNPVERLTVMLDMLSKFSNLTGPEWQDLYQMEIDAINYNYEHYRSGRYLEFLKAHKD